MGSSNINNNTDVQQPVHWAMQQNNHNSIIENLSTLRSSEINERERNLMEKVKLLKQENKKLMQLLKDSEINVIDKISK